MPTDTDSCDYCDEAKTRDCACGRYLCQYCECECEDAE